MRNASAANLGHSDKNPIQMLVAMVKMTLNYTYIMLKSQAIDQEVAAKQGFLLIDKPAGMTSHDVVDRVRKLTGERRVGHAGTLDPFATGLLIVGVGRLATREMEKLVGLDKEYEATFVLGKSSTTDDTEGEITDAPLHNLSMITTPSPSLKRRGTEEKEDVLRKAIQQFIGKIDQIPPTYSAIKIGGKKMYEAAREGKPMEAKARQVNVYSFELHNLSMITTPSPSLPAVARLWLVSRSFSEGGKRRGIEEMEGCRITVTIRCSSGTYIRSLARDLGRALGGGGYVEQLRRTEIGPFSLSQAQTLEALQNTVQTALIPVATLLSSL